MSGTLVIADSWKSSHQYFETSSFYWFLEILMSSLTSTFLLIVMKFINKFNCSGRKTFLLKPYLWSFWIYPRVLISMYQFLMDSWDFYENSNIKIVFILSFVVCCHVEVVLNVNMYSSDILNFCIRLLDDPLCLWATYSWYFNKFKFLFNLVFL